MARMRVTHSKASTQRITDLCIAINCVEGTDVAPEYVKEGERVLKTLYALMLEEATNLHLDHVSYKRLNSALHKAGWDDNYFQFDDHGKICIKGK